eukprot:3864404-Rhodomonas_salina.2
MRFNVRVRPLIASVGPSSTAHISRSRLWPFSASASTLSAPVGSSAASNRSVSLRSSPSEHPRFGATNGSV